MESEIKVILKEYGLDEAAADIYLYLVGKKQLTAYAIAKECKLHRSTCYDVLNRLVAQGFVSLAENAGIKYYAANDPSHVLGRIEQKASLIQDLIPKVQALEAHEETTVRYAGSKHSFAEFNTKLYRQAKAGELTFLYMISNSPDLTTASSRIMGERLLKEAANKSFMHAIDAKGLWDQRFRNDPFMQLFATLGENRFLDHLPSKATLFIYDEHIAYVFLGQQDEFIEIKNAHIAQEMKAYFSYLWTLGKK